MILDEMKRFVRIFFEKRNRKDVNAYDHIISLGYNCEVQFRFLKYFGFEDSNLFNWVSSHNIDLLLKTLKNFKKIGSGDFIGPNPISKLWTCAETSLIFHGKLEFIKGREITEEDIKNDKEDLKGRVTYLKKKFLKYASNNKKKLYIYKIKNEDAKQGIIEKIKELKSLLIKLGAKNFQLLIVFEEKKSQFFNEEIENVIFRSVKYFAPDSAVTSKDCFDNGWDDIYKEFYVTNKYQNNRC